MKPDQTTNPEIQQSGGKASPSLDCSGFADRLQASRKMKGWTQAEAAKQAGMAPAQWAFYEQGIRDATVKNLIRICEALGVSADDLLGLPNAELRDAGEGVE